MDEKMDRLLASISDSFQAGDYAAVIKYCDQALILAPKDAKLLLARADCHMLRKEFKAALLDFNESINQNPAIAESYNSRATCYSLMLLPSLAIDDYVKAIKIEPDNGSYYRNRAEIYSRIGSYAMAEKDCTAAIKIDESDFEAYLKRARACAEMGRTREAYEDCNKAETINATPLVFRTRGHILMSQERYAESLVEFDKALVLDSKSADVVFEKALLETNRKHFASAKDFYEKALLIEPNTTFYLCGMADFLSSCPDLEVRDLDKAIALAKRANEISQGASPAPIMIIASTYARKGLFAEAIAAQEKALALPPDSFFGTIDKAREKLKTLKAGTVPKD
jgi:tetratricopeptide (TPR) repeat protein